MWTMTPKFGFILPLVRFMKMMSTYTTKGYNYLVFKIDVIRITLIKDQFFKYLLNIYQLLLQISQVQSKVILLKEMMKGRFFHIKDFTSIKLWVGSVLNLVMQILTMVQVDSAVQELKMLIMDSSKMKIQIPLSQKEEEISLWQIKVIQIATIHSFSLRLINQIFSIQKEKMQSNTKNLVKLQKKIP